MVAKQRMRHRIKLLFMPYILTLAGLIIGYTVLHWVLFIELELLQFEKAVTNFIIPFALTGLAALFILRPRLNILALESRKANWKDFLTILIWIFLTIPLVISQEYIVTASGKLTQLNSIHEINRFKTTKYYSFQNYHLDKHFVRTYPSFDVSGKRNENFNMHIYVAVPIVEKESNITDLEPIAWLGTEYRKTVKNNLEPREKEREYQAFANESRSDFEEKNIDGFSYLERLGPSAKREGYIAAIKTNRIYRPNEIVFEAVYEPFEARNGKKLEWIIGTSLIGSVLWFLIILIPRVDQQYQQGNPVRKSDKEAKEYLGYVISYLTPKKNYIITPVLMYANIGFYLIMVIAGLGFFSFNVPDLYHWGANFGPLTRGGEWWRLFTSIFLHGGLLHLLANIYGLLFVGMPVEKKLGSVNFLLLYFLSGLFAGIASLNFNIFEVSVGASGSIFGIYGFLMVETIRKNPTNTIFILVNFISYLLIFLLVGTYINVDHAAHIAGAITGVLVGISYRKLKIKVVYTIGVAGILISFLISPTYQASYFNTFQKFVSNDLRINKIIEARLNDKDFYDSLHRIKNLPQESIADFRNLDYIPDRLSKDTTVIVDYLRLTSKKIDYFLEGLARESFIYLDSIGLINSTLSNLPKLAYNLNFNAQPAADETEAGNLEHLRLVRQNYDSSWLEVSSDEFDYYRIGQKDSLGDWHGSVVDYFQNGAIQMKGTFQRGLKEGIFIYYSSDSTYSSAGRYMADDRIGKWENYHKSGKLYIESRHGNGFSYIENLWDSTGRQVVIKGNGTETYTHSNGLNSYSRNIVDGLNEGFVESYYENGDLKFKEYYEKGILIKGVSFMDNTENSYDWSINNAYPSGGFENFNEYINKENKLKSDSIEATVVMRFDVHASGELQNIRFLKRSSEIYNQHAKELLMNGPKWIPARSHGLMDVTSFAEVRIEF